MSNEFTEHYNWFRNQGFGHEASEGAARRVLAREKKTTRTIGHTPKPDELREVELREEQPNHSAELQRNLRRLGLSEEQAERQARTMSDHAVHQDANAQAVDAYQRLGLSESAAKQAAAGRREVVLLP